jgi:hypothetical protein
LSDACPVSISYTSSKTIGNVESIRYITPYRNARYIEGAWVAGCVNIMMNGRMSLFLNILLIRSPVSNSVRTTTSFRMPFIAFLTAFAFLARMAGAKVSGRKKRAVS